MDDLSVADNRVLQALYTMQYLTAEQLCRLLYAFPSTIRYAQDKLKRLSESGYLLRDSVPTKNGRSPHYYLLSTKGFSYLSERHDIPRRRVCPPSDEEGLYIRHALSIVDFLVQSVCFTRENQAFHVERMHHDRNLKEMNMQVTLPNKKVRTVTPDGWIDLQAPQLHERYCVALEVERTVKESRRWIPKVEGLLEWAKTTMRPTFDTREVTIAVVVKDNDNPGRRRDLLVKETELALTKLGKEGWSNNLCFYGGDVLEVSATELFTSPLWRQPFKEEMVALIEG